MAKTEAGVLGNELRELHAQLTATKEELLSSKDEVRHCSSEQCALLLALQRTARSDEKPLFWQVCELSTQQDASAERLRACAIEKQEHANVAAAVRVELAGLTQDLQLLRHAWSWKEHPDLLTQ